MNKILNDLFTGKDNNTHDPARWLWIVGVIVFLIYTGYYVYKTDKFDEVNFSIAYGTLLGAGATGCKIKESTEPTADDTKD